MIYVVLFSGKPWLMSHGSRCWTYCGSLGWGMVITISSCGQHLGCIALQLSSFEMKLLAE